MKSGGLCSVGFKPEGAEVAPVPCCALCPLTRPRSRIPVASPLPLAAVRLGLPETALARDRSSLQWAARRISLSASVQRSCSLLAAQASKGEELARHMAPGGSPSRQVLCAHCTITRGREHAPPKGVPLSLCCPSAAGRMMPRGAGKCARTDIPRSITPHQRYKRSA